MSDRVEPESQLTEMTLSPQGSILLLLRVPLSPGFSFVCGSLVRVSVMRVVVMLSLFIGIRLLYHL